MPAQALKEFTFEDVARVGVYGPLVHIRLTNDIRGSITRKGI